MNALQNKISEMSTEMLIKVVKGLEDIFSFEADIVFEAALQALEERLPEDKFIEMCEAL